MNLSTEKTAKPRVTQVTIERQLPHGYLVRDTDNHYGLLRAREIFWDIKKPWKGKFKPGQSIEVVKTLFLGESTEYSFRLAERDPWDGVSKRYKTNQLVLGTVENVSATTAWVEIEPGINGILHRADMPDWLNPEFDMQTCFWPGDTIKAAIKKIDYNKQLLKLNLATGRKKFDIFDDPILVDQNRQIVQSQKREATYQLLSVIPPKVIWIVEDDEAQSKSIGHWLSRHGHSIKTFETAEDCLEQLKIDRCDIIFTDIGLPNMNGLELVDELAQDYTEIPCIMMTDLLRISQSVEMKAYIDMGFAVMCKPILLDDIAKLLHRLEMGTKSENQKRRAEGVKLPRTDDQLGIKSDKQANKKVLKQLLQQTSAEQAILFSIDPLNRQVKIVEKVGNLKIYTSMLSELIHSPVRDAAEDKQTVEIRNAHEQSDYSRYLKRTISFGSCVGAPVFTNQSLDYALFVFHRTPKFFAHFHPNYVEAAAFRVGALLEQQQWMRQISGIQQLAMLGNLSRAMVHELNHKLGPIAFATEDLEDRCEQILATYQASTSQTEEVIEQTVQDLNELSGNIESLLRTAKLFGELTAQTENELVKVEEVIDDVVWIVRDIARDYKVRVNWEKPEKMHLTRANPSQLPQVLLNTLMNSIQQIDEMRLNRQALLGDVSVAVQFKHVDHQAFIEIEIKDNGPGIHEAIWERIFEWGYTLGSHKGNGLGLFIARDLLEGMGGTIKVDSSHRFWGTIFCIQLPVTLAS